MTLRDLLSGGNIVRQDTSRQEIQELLKVAARSITDARVERLSFEGRFALAYDGALQLSMIPMRCHGYRTRGEGHHWAVFDALPELMDSGVSETADYFQTCRRKRSTAIYRQSSVVTQAEIVELLVAVDEFDRQVRQWLKKQFPQYA